MGKAGSGRRGQAKYTDVSSVSQAVMAKAWRRGSDSTSQATVQQQAIKQADTAALTKSRLWKERRGGEGS